MLNVMLRYLSLHYLCWVNNLWLRVIILDCYIIRLGGQDIMSDVGFFWFLEDLEKRGIWFVE